MTRVVVTKAQIIEALRTESLAPGSFVSYSAGCPVCAVGAVFRAAGLSDGAIVDAADDLVAHAMLDPDECEDYTAVVRQMLVYGGWLDALSCLYEAACASKGPDEAREEAVAFVVTYFPSTITLSYDDDHGWQLDTA